MKDKIDSWEMLLAAIASGLFLGDLFLGWHRTTVEVAGAVSIEETSSGWAGWGAVAGVFAVLLLVVAFNAARGKRLVAHHALAVVILTLGLVVAAALAVFTGAAEIEAVGVGVEASARLWPATAGAVLAVAAAAAALVALIVEACTTPRRLPAHAA